MLPRQVLERQRVLLQAERVREFVDRQLRQPEPTLAVGQEQVSEQELAKLRDRLDEALDWARRVSTATASAPMAFIPRDLTLSNLQSLAANRLTIDVPLTSPPTEVEPETLLVQSPIREPGGQVIEGVRAAGGGTTVAIEPVTGYSVADRIDDALGLSQQSGRADGELLLPEPYGPEDPVWLTIALAVAFRKYEEHELGKLPFNSTPASAVLGEHARLFIFGDWGTGTERAQNVADAIHAKLAEPESQARDCHVIHLGDTYVAGWWWEQLLHVIRYWPVRSDARATSWALAGNHDYYSGTDGYFGVLLRHRLFTLQQGDGKPTSIFELSNEHWCILGLDSSWVDHDLPPAELAWLETAIERAAQHDQKLILLSHHQPWSAFGDGPHPPLWKRALALWRRLKAMLTGRRTSTVTALWQKVQPLLATHRADAWFWGHEHRLALYKPTAEIERPRLVGNGGVPSEVTDASYYTNKNSLLFDYETPYPGDPTWCQFAFAVVDIDDDQFSETYFDEAGSPIAV